MTKNNTIEWQNKTFKQLSTDELYDLLKLRVDIFVVEQTCYYPELDEKDRDLQTRHLCGYLDHELVAYARILPPNLSYRNCASIGRVALVESIRGQGFADELIEHSIALCIKHWPTSAIKIGAQSYLINFYTKHGFKIDSEEYLEDGIPHIDMVRVSNR